MSEIAADARRYRWLRERWVWYADAAEPCPAVAYRNELLDEMIDAARGECLDCAYNPGLCDTHNA